MTKPVLYVFAISHFCEKASWALDSLGIEYSIRHLAPGLHAKKAKKIGAATSTLPILELTNDDAGSGEEGIVQGSSNIIDWAEKHSAAGKSTLEPSDDKREAERIERRLDDVLGVHLRRQFYSEALVDCPQTVRPIFTKDLPPLQKLIIGMAWGKISKIMIRRMDLGPQQRLESREFVAAELDWLDGLLLDDREFLVGKSFSRVDIAAASLLSPLVRPKQHRDYAALSIPPHFSEDSDLWSGRKSVRWAAEMYRLYR